MASTSVHRSVRSEENVGSGVRSGKSADSQTGTRPARKALGDISNRTTNSSAQKSASKKALGQTKLTHNASAAPSTGRRRKAAKVDLENPPDVEKMTPFREKVEGTSVDKELLAATKNYKADLRSFLSPADLCLSQKDIPLPEDMDTLFSCSSPSSSDSRDEACQFEDLMRASEAARVEAASLEASLEPDLDSLLQELSLF